MRIIRAKMGQAMCTAGERRSRQKKCRGLECACTTLGAGSWGLGGMGARRVGGAKGRGAGS